MMMNHLDAKVFGHYAERRESEASAAESSSATNSNTSYSTAPTPASTSSPGQTNTFVGKVEAHDDDMLDAVDAKPAISSLDSLLRTSSSASTTSPHHHHLSDLSEVASSKKPSVQAIVVHLETVVRTFIDAINNRTLTLDHPVTASFDPKFTANTPPPWPQGTEDLAEYLQRLIALAAQTEYKMVIQGLDTHVYKNGHAGVFVTSDVLGVPPDVVRHVVAIFRFRKRDGLWRCFIVEEIIGIENTADGEPGSSSGGFAGPF